MKKMITKKIKKRLSLQKDGTYKLVQDRLKWSSKNCPICEIAKLVMRKNYFECLGCGYKEKYNKYSEILEAFK